MARSKSTVRQVETIGSGDLKTRLRFESRNKVKDGFGNERGEWELVFERYCYLEPIIGYEQAEQGHAQSVQGGMAFVRYDIETAQIRAHWRVVESDGTVWNIETADDAERTKRFITLTLTRGKAP